MADAGAINIVLSVNKASFSAAMADAQRQLDTFAGKAKGAGHSTVSSMQAASASIRLLENPLGSNIRAIERLISQSKVLSNVMKVAFPVVGSIAIGVAIAKLGKDVYDFVVKMNAVPKAIQDGFASMNLSARSANDALDLTNAKLQNEINKLENKPQNNLKTALFESRVEADNLATSLARDAKAVNELLTQNSVGLLGGLIGKAPTSSVSSSVQVYLNDLMALGNQLSDAAQKPNNDAQIASLKSQITAKQNAGLQWAKSKLFVTDNPQYAGPDDDIMGGDQAANRAILLGFQGTILNQQHHQSSEDTNKQLTGQKEVDEAKKDAARVALEAQKKAAAEQLAQWESDNSDWKAAQDRSLQEDAAWWKAKLETLTTGSLNYKTVNKKMNADIIADNREYAEGIAKFTTEFMNDGMKSDWLTKDATDYVTTQGKAAADWIKNLREGIDLQKQSSDAIAQSSLEMAVATGQMTKMDAAQVLSNLHTTQYNEALKALQDSRSMIQNDSSLTDLQRRAQLANNDNQLGQLNFQRGIQVQQDSQVTNPAASLASVGFIDALNDFVHASQNAANQMKEITDNTLNSINAEIVKGISGQRTNFKGAGAGIFRNIAGVGLQKAEGSILSGLGFGGKPDGSQGKPLYVRIANGLGLKLGSAGGGSSSSDSSGDGSPISGLGSLFMSALPMLASGGPLSANTMAIVGERGPELFMPSTSGSIIPNHQLSGLSSGGDTHYWNIDARGATDPAQTTAQINRAMQQNLPAAVTASQRAAQETRKRTPSTQK